MRIRSWCWKGGELSSRVRMRSYCAATLSIGGWFTANGEGKTDPSPLPSRHLRAAYTKGNLMRRYKAMPVLGLWKRGFTLIELLVVIAIISVLAAILFPVFARVREKARQATCQSNLKQIEAAVQMYAQDYDETLPSS